MLRSTTHPRHAQFHGFERIDWVHVLVRYAMTVNPLLRDEEVGRTWRS